MKHFWLCLFLGIPSLATASPYSDFNAGLAALDREDNGAAMTAFNAALAAPDLLPAFRAAAYFDRGKIYTDEKKWDLAIADLTAALKIDPEYLDAYDLRSQAYENNKHLDLAIADLTAIISRRPSFMEMYLRRGTLFLKNNSFDAAIADANTVLDILSNVERANPDTFVGNTVDFERAAPNTVVNIGPAIGRAYQFRGVFYHKKGDIERALADDENSIKLDPRTSAAYYDRGTISQERGEFAQAADDFARFSEIDPKSAPVRFRIGVVDWELGKFGDALQDFSDTTIEPDKDLAVDYALWRWIAAAKAGKGETFNPSGKQIANDGSSKSILDLYEGKGSIEALMKSSKEAASKGGVCKANFFGGIWQEIHADKSTAIAMLGAAVSDCPSDYIERSAASAELKRLQ